MDGTPMDPGVNSLALQHMFRLIGEDSDSVTVSMSVLEIYNDAIRDLLISGSHEGSNGRTPQRDSRKERGLHVLRISGDSDVVHVPGLTSTAVRDLNDVNGILKKAKKRRSVSSTGMNTSSSRSHLIVEVVVQKRESTSRLHLVDLAGSERVSRSGVQGVRLQEAIHINKSLSLLGNVFSALERSRRHIPYRDCKLTHFLKNSIGGLSKTLMFLTISGDDADQFETKATLQFGKRVGKISIQTDHTEEKVQRLRDLEDMLRNIDCEVRNLRGLLEPV